MIRARHLPEIIYSSQAIYEEELRRYFYRDWLYAGPGRAVRQPGRLRGASRAGPADHHHAATRTACSAAFYNMCRHRGVEVAEGRGNARLFKARTTAGRTTVSGKLIGAAYMKDSDGFDPKTCRLPRIHLEVWRGNIFISFAAEPPPFAQAMAEFEKDFGQLSTEKCRGCRRDAPRAELQLEVHAREPDGLLSRGVLHVKSFGARFSWTTENGLRLKDNGGITIRYDAAPSTPGGEALFGKAPWLEAQPNSFACTGFMPPNVTLFEADRLREDHGRLANRSRQVRSQPSTCCFRNSSSPIRSSTGSSKVYKDYQAIIYEEDRSMIESMQRAMALPVYEPGRMSVMEKPIHHFLNGYLDRMFGPRG